MKMEQGLSQAQAFLGELSVKRGIITSDPLEVALAVQRQSDMRPGEVLIGQGVLRERHLRVAFRLQHNLRFALFLLAAVTPLSGQAEPPGKAEGSGSSTSFSSPLATTNGTTGATSTGSSAITLTIPSRIRVMGFKDITLGTYNGVALTGGSPACVSRNGPGNYSVTMTSTNGSYVLKSGTQATIIPYTVTWAANDIPYNKATGTFLTDNTTLAACTPVANRLTVTVPSAGMDTALPGAYADTLSVMVTPL